MTAAVPTVAVAFAAMVLVAAAIVALTVSFRPAEAAARHASPAPTWQRPDIAPTRLAAGVTTAVAVLVLTRWPVLALVAGALIAMWPQLLHDRRSDAERRHVEGIAKWLEDLRDTLRGSSVGTEEALEQVATRAPEAVREPLAAFVARRRQGFRTEDALADLADDLAHPTSDAAVAAIRLVVTGSTGSGRLYQTVSTLAVAARDEVRARERVDRTRAVYRSSMTRLVAIAALMVGGLRLVAHELLEPYGTPTGQLVLLLPLALWGACIMWLRSLCRYDQSGRYRIAGSRT
ncbi:MAG: hypothetical protein KDB40_23750 [Acidimicrobiales bacterium]|nr:hypothetical protein [Acidimicrobiales bacterium]MCB9392544.1 type II secretion system protein [Acidimicrobiaceae bacterium]